MNAQSPGAASHVASSSLHRCAPAPLTLHLLFTSDWGVGTGVGIAGGVDSTVEKDHRGLPVVRASVLTGIIREQAKSVADSLDGASKGPWHEFVHVLFGNERESSPESQWRPHRLITFTDAMVTDTNASPEKLVHEVVSLSIDEQTGTAKEDHLRFFERVGTCRLEGEVEFLSVDLRGRTVPWTNDTVEAARFLLTLSGLLVESIGSNRSDGDGQCTIVIGEDEGAVLDAQNTEAASQAKRWCLDYLRKKESPPDASTLIAQDLTAPRIGRTSQEASSAPSRPSSLQPEFLHATLTITLDSPLVSYDVPLSNEIRSLDFLRGTTILPWVHNLLRNSLPDDEGVARAVVNGQLLVSDALPVSKEIRGLPIPLVLSSPKTERSDDESKSSSSSIRTFTNRLKVGEPSEVHKPVRDGFVFIDPGLTGGVQVSSSTTGDVVGYTGAPAVVGRQSAAHDSATGATAPGALFLVRALPRGLQLQATISIEKSLYDHLERHLGDQLIGVFTRECGIPAFMGARRYSGSFGRVTCHVGDFTMLDDADDARESLLSDDGELTLWFTSDVVVRTSLLGGAADINDLLRAFQRHGIPLKQSHDKHDGRFTAGVRHRRVDSWSAHDHQPRPTRMAIKAGSVLKVVMDCEDLETKETALRALLRLGTTGIGELTAQGFGRFILCPDLLELDSFSVHTLDQSDFVSTLAPMDGTDSAAPDQPLDSAESTMPREEGLRS